MSRLRRTLSATVLSLATFLPAGFASAADLTVKAKPVAEVPFFLVIDNRVSFSWMPKGTDPGMFTVNANGSINGTTAKQVYSFTHFDAWAYGTNFFTISMFKSGHNDPASPCVAPGVTITGGAANCAGATEIYGRFRSTFGFNEIFNTKAFTMGPLRNVSLEVGMDANTENNFLAPAKVDAAAAPQCRIDLAVQRLRECRPVDVLGVLQPQLVHPVRPVWPRHSWNYTAIPTATSRIGRHGRSRSTITWISVSCRRTCSTSRSAAAPAGTDRRAI